MTGLQQHGLGAVRSRSTLLDPSVFQPWNRSNMSACAAVVRPKVTTTALQILIHFMTQSLLPLGFTSWAVSSGRRRAGKNFLRRQLARIWFGRVLAARDARRVFSEITRPRSHAFRRQNVFHHAKTAFDWPPCLGTGSLPMPSFQAIQEVAPSLSVCEGLDQSIGGIRTTA